MLQILPSCPNTVSAYAVEPVISCLFPYPPLISLPAAPSFVQRMQKDQTCRTPAKPKTVSFLFHSKALCSNLSDNLTPAVFVRQCAVLNTRNRIVEHSRNVAHLSAVYFIVAIFIANKSHGRNNRRRTRTKRLF